jgi:hypothetical protein
MEPLAGGKASTPPLVFNVLTNVNSTIGLLGEHSPKSPILRA